jgi:hypothetical protein
MSGTFAASKSSAGTAKAAHKVPERLIGSIRRECMDHIIVLGEAHLRRILKSYAHYYNGSERIGL